MEFDLLVFLGLIIVGIIFGVVAVMVGIGGGLMYVPFLTYALIFFPSISENLDLKIASLVSSFIIIFNSSAGFLKFRSLKRVDYQTAKSFLIVAIPGALIGAIVGSVMDSDYLKIIFAVMVVLASLRGIKKSLGSNNDQQYSKEEAEENSYVRREITDSDGDTKVYYANIKASQPFAFVGGFIAGLLGLGGGIIFMPLLLTIAKVPIHFAVASSSLIIFIVSIFVVIFKSIALYQTGGTIELSYFLYYGIPLAIGAVIGGIFGAAKLKKINSKYLLIGFWIIALISGIRMAIGVLT